MQLLLLGEKILNQNMSYSDNQKAMEYKDDIIAILKRFVTKRIFLLVT